jgi:hypothetical protein
MPGKVIKIETAMMARLPQARGEVWEVGRRRLEISIAEMKHTGERPDLLLAVQTSGQGGAVQANIVSSNTPPATLADFVSAAMRQPLTGKPRRPQLIRVNSQVEAAALSETLATVGVRVEGGATLADLDALVEEMGAEFGGIAGDYRTRAARAGESLSDESLRALFGTARAFYRAELWRDFGDEVMFEIELQLGRRRPKTLYGIVMGNMGQEFGLALYASLDEFRRFYEFSLQHLDQLMQPQEAAGKGRSVKARQRQADDMLAKISSVSAIGLTFTPQRDVPPSLVQEAKQLHLPLANKSAFPLIMRLGAGGMTVGTADDLRDVYVATHAILEWDRGISAMEVDDAIGVTITSKLPAIHDFLPALTARTTLRLNPYVPEADQALPSELSEFLGALFEVEPIPAAPASAKSPRTADDKSAQTRTPKAPRQPAAAKSPHISSNIPTRTGRKRSRRTRGTD